MDKREAFLDLLLSRCVLFNGSQTTEEDFVEAVENTLTKLNDPRLASLPQDSSFMKQLWQKFQQLQKRQEETNSNKPKYEKNFCVSDLTEKKNYTFLMSECTSSLAKNSFQDKTFFSNPHFRPYSSFTFQEICLLLEDLKNRCNEVGEINGDRLALTYLRWRKVAKEFTVAQNRSVHSHFCNLLSLWSTEQKTKALPSDMSVVLNKLLSVVLDEYMDSGLNIMTFLRAYLTSVASSSKTSVLAVHFDKTVASAFFQRLMELPSKSVAQCDSDVHWIDCKKWTNTQLLLLLWSIYEYHCLHFLIEKKMYFELIQWTQQMFNAQNLAKIFDEKPDSFLTLGDKFFEQNSHLIQYEENAEEVAVDELGDETENEEFSENEKKEQDDEEKPGDELGMENNEDADENDLNGEQLFTVDIFNEQQNDELKSHDNVENDKENESDNEYKETIDMLKFLDDDTSNNPEKMLVD